MFSVNEYAEGRAEWDISSVVIGNPVDGQIKILPSLARSRGDYFTARKEEAERHQVWLLLQQ